MTINKRLEKLEEVEHAKLNAEFVRLVGLLCTSFSEEEKQEISLVNNIDRQPMPGQDRETTIREFLNSSDLTHKRCVIEGLQRLIEKWQTSLRQRAIDPDWDSSSLIDPLFQQVNQNGG